MKEKILHIAAHLGGGAGKAISGLAIGLSSYYDNSILLLEEPEQERYIKVCIENDITVTIAKNSQDIKEQICEADYVIFSWWGHPLSLEVFKELKEVKTRVFLWSHVNGLFFPFLQPEFLKEFDGVFLTSSCTYENTKWTKEQRECIIESSEIIYGIGKFEPQKLPKKDTYDSSEVLKIGYAGTVNYNKMSKDFPQICSQILQKIPNVEFYFYGLYEEASYNSFIEYDGRLKEVMHFEGYVKDIEKRLAQLDVFCYPLNEENFATTENALLEAMAVGLPVVVLNNPAERNIITHQVDGYIANDIDDMCDFIKKLGQSKEVAEKIGENARRNVVQKYDYKANAYNCACFIEKFRNRKKKTHDILSIVGESAGQVYLYFSQMTIDKYKENDLSEILRGETKGSLKHYLRYYSDDILNELKTIRVKREETIK